jgi:hypothetical protein
VKGRRSGGIELIGNLAEALDELSGVPGSGTAPDRRSLWIPGSRSRSAVALATAASSSAAGMRQPLAPAAMPRSIRSALT